MTQVLAPANIEATGESRPALNPAKFRDPSITADGAPRARVGLERLETLWINTGSLCNIECRGCYIESSPRNDRLAYISLAEARDYLDEIHDQGLAVAEIGFTGGEPFMNRDLPAMLAESLARGFRALVLTNAMKPLWHRRDEVADLARLHGRALAIRVSIDHFTQAGHEDMRGPGTWAPMLQGLKFLGETEVQLSVAARQPAGETEEETRAGFERLFRAEGLPLDARSPADLVLFPEMDEDKDVPEITEACWGILGKKPGDVMCATSRMVVKRKGADRPMVLPCTLLPYDRRFEMGPRLADADGPVALNHPHCATFCVLGGASCSGGT